MYESLEGERQMISGAEGAMPLCQRPDVEAGAAPGVGESHAASLGMSGKEQPGGLLPATCM